MQGARAARSTAAVIAVALALSIGPVADALRPAALAQAAQGAARVRLGVVGTASDSGFFIALERGFFREQGLDVETAPFDTAVRMVAPLGASQLDVGGGSHSVGLFNAAARGVAIRMVADKGSALPGHGFIGLLIRRDLVDSGRVRTAADLRGLRVASATRGTVSEGVLNAWLSPYGVSADQVEVVEMAFPDHAAALNGRTVEAAVTVEPFLTRVADQGLASLYGRLDAVSPGHQIAEVFYADAFAREQADAAHRFMRAYLRAVRYYNDAFGGGDVAKRQDVIGILTRQTPVTDPALYERMALPGLHPDGALSVPSIAADQEIWLQLGMLPTRLDLSHVVDTSFAEAAAQALGPYR